MDFPKREFGGGEHTTSGMKKPRNDEKDCQLSVVSSPLLKANY
jgi:hypothetical protein